MGKWRDISGVRWQPRVAGGRRFHSVLHAVLNPALHSVLRHLPSVIDSAIDPYPINFNTCSANSAMPSPENPMRVSVIVHVRRV